MKRFVAGATAALGIAVAIHAGPAAADDITVTGVAVPYNEILTIDSPLASPVTAYVGQIVLTTSAGATIDAWCIDLFHDVNVGGGQDLPYTIVPILTNNDPDYASGTSLTSNQIDEIAGLVVYGDDLLAAGGADTTLDQDSAAVQLAIWSIEYPTFSYSGGSGSLTTQTADLISDAQAGDFTGAASEVEGLDGQQSFATAVPEPGAAVLFATALLGLGAFRRRFPRPAGIARPAV